MRRCCLVFAMVLACLLGGCRLYSREKPPDKETYTVYTYDLMYIQSLGQGTQEARNRIYDESMLITSLQGIVNRVEPRLHIRYVRERVERNGYYELGRNMDDYWLDKVRTEQGWLSDAKLVRVHSLPNLLEVFSDYYQGVVVWDPSVPATANVACTVAGIEDLLVVRYDTSPDSWYTKLVTKGKLKVKKWLVNKNGTPMFTGTGTIPGTTLLSSGSSKGDAYLWAKYHYLDSGLANPNKMGYYVDSYITNFPWGRVQANGILNRDYFISQRAFFFDLSPLGYELPVDDPGQPMGTDRHVLEEILKSAYLKSPDTMVHIGGYIPWGWKYTNWKEEGGHNAGGRTDPVKVEWAFVRLISAYNAYLDADALDGSGIGAMSNASFYTHYPLKDVYRQNPKPTLADLKRKGYVDSNGKVVAKNYIAFFVGDWDSAAWVYTQIPHLWEDPARGSIPLNWALNPNLADRSGHVFAYMRETMTSNDFFVAGASGAGYINPGMLEKSNRSGYSGLESGVEVWTQHNIPYYRRWDLSVTGFIIDGDAPGIGAEVKRAYKEFSPSGIVAQKIGTHGVFEGMPYVQKTYDISGAPAEACWTIQRYMWNLPGFYVFRGILQKPSWYRDVEAELRRVYGDNVAIVDMYTLMALVELYHS
jgi:hypothetical protein